MAYAVKLLSLARLLQLLWRIRLASKFASRLVRIRPQTTRLQRYSRLVRIRPQTTRLQHYSMVCLWIVSTAW